jgi:hypothetical protein
MFLEERTTLRRWASTIALSFTFLSSATMAAPPPPDGESKQQEIQRLAKLPPVVETRAGLDHSGRKQKRQASYYAHRFANRKTASGNRFNPAANTAASKTLPLGTTAKVTNEQNGESATIKIDDRGPYINGRVVDVTPHMPSPASGRPDPPNCERRTESHARGRARRNVQGAQQVPHGLWPRCRTCGTRGSIGRAPRSSFITTCRPCGGDADRETGVQTQVVWGWRWGCRRGSGGRCTALQLRADSPESPVPDSVKGKSASLIVRVMRSET